MQQLLNNLQQIDLILDESKSYSLDDKVYTAYIVLAFLVHKVVYKTSIHLYGFQRFLNEMAFTISDIDELIHQLRKYTHKFIHEVKSLLEDE